MKSKKRIDSGTSQAFLKFKQVFLAKGRGFVVGVFFAESLVFVFAELMERQQLGPGSADFAERSSKAGASRTDRDDDPQE